MLVPLRITIVFFFCSHQQVTVYLSSSVPEQNLCPRTKTWAIGLVTLLEKQHTEACLYKYLLCWFNGKLSVSIQWPSKVLGRCLKNILVPLNMFLVACPKRYCHGTCPKTHDITTEHHLLRNMDGNTIVSPKTLYIYFYFRLRLYIAFGTVQSFLSDGDLSDSQTLIQIKSNHKSINSVFFNVIYCFTSAHRRHLADNFILGCKSWIIKTICQRD